MDFVLSKSNLNIINKLNELKPIDIKNVERLDLSDRNSYMFKVGLLKIRQYFQLFK